MMKCNIKRIIIIMALIVVIKVLTGCSMPNQNNDVTTEITREHLFGGDTSYYVYDIKGYTYDRFIDDYGSPHSTDTLVLKSDTNLLEFQNGILDYIPKQSLDSLIVLQYNYHKGDTMTIMWNSYINGERRVLDVLEWDTSQIIF